MNLFKICCDLLHIYIFTNKYISAIRGREREHTPPFLQLKTGVFVKTKHGLSLRFVD